MNASKDNWLLAAGVLVPWCACLAAWLADSLVGVGPWPLRAGVMGGALLVASGSLGFLLYRARMNACAVERHFEALCDLDVCDLSLDGGPQAPPALPAGHSWSKVADCVRGTLDECRHRVRDLKHTRTAWEVRYRRATDECERIRTILMGLSEPIIAVDNFDELLLANAAAERLFHFDAQTAERRDVAQLVRCEKLVELVRAASRRKTTAARSEEIEIADAGGASHWYRVSLSKLQPAASEGDPGQEPSHGVVAVLRDIEREKTQQKRHAEFVSAVSHEMKTPLAGIKAYVELLVDGDAEDEATREEFLAVINGQADRLQRLIDNMLNLARIEAGVVSVHKKSRSLNELLEEAVHVVQPAAEAKNIELVTELSPLYLGILADRDMLLQSAINLLSNAIKYTPEGGRVTLRSRLADNEVVFEVEDTGVGLSEEDQQRVFEKFYRVAKDKTMASGTGLGLPLAKHIVEDVHGGRLAVESTLGAGSTFCVTLPGAGQMA
jgi:two-component system phosphate regulon sensor histidine kinase PhoR